MPFGLVIGTERANALQLSIEHELTKRGYSPDPDPVMAEYITIMVINNKTSAQITSELEDLIGSDYNASFTDWLFEEAAKGSAEPSAEPDATPKSPPPQQTDPGPSKSIPTYIASEASRPRNGIYQQALSQALPSGSAQKRSASARSPSPTHPNKSRRTDLPTGPRAMYRDGAAPNGVPHPNPRSLLDRVGGPANRGPKNFQRDEIQARIDNIVGTSPEMNNMMMQPNFPGMGIDMNAMANIASPLMLQEMMMNQMALMAQMASSMGIINPGTGQFGGQGFPMQGMPNDMNAFQNGMNNTNGFAQQQQTPGSAGPGRGRGGAQRGGRGTGRGRGGAGGPGAVGRSISGPDATAGNVPSPIAAPTPIAPTPLTSAPSAEARAAAPAQVQIPYALPERPQSPTLCKFALKCTNAHCRYSHPSPVATAESGVVLSNEACEKGKNCKDKDCIKAHVSPAVLNPQAEQAPPSAAAAVAPQTHHNPVPCRFGAACTRPGCTFSHPQRPSHFATQCRFGAGCTRAQCPFQHPEGRVLPTSFHRGLSTTGPIVSVPTPETGSMGSSQNRSVTFNNPTPTMKEKLEKQMKEIQEKKSEAEKAVKDAEAAAATGKKADSKPVSITA
ncbi:hypothetical protein BDN70DRAFT_988327 [Pholiota conissans]|uniref:C3H1-type domain-containing protein n=1 Tax=Pholiota conissans TaxID=109636 RepID=A0A9P6D7Q1_9AGAR|nr:hypothetical protein BDN70DRAFT_988327 [Pholiota conissans]